MKYRSLIIMFALALFCAGCQRDVISGVTDAPELAVSVDIHTKASYDKTAFIGAEDVSFWVTNDRSGTLKKLQPDANYADNNKFVYNSTTGKLEADGSKITFPGLNAKLGVYAVYPYSADYKLTTSSSATVLSHSVIVDQSVEANYVKSDLMTGSRGWSGYSVTDMTSPAAITFFHRMAKLDITVEVPEKYGDADLVGVNYVKITNNIIKAKVQMSVTAEDAAVDPNTTMAAVTDGKVVETITMHKYKEDVSETPHLFMYEAVTVPQTVASSVPLVEISVKFKNGLVEEDRFFYYMTGSDIAFAGGKSHTLKLSVSDLKPIVVEDVKITQWNASSSSGGMVE